MVRLAAAVAILPAGVVYAGPARAAGFPYVEPPVVACPRVKEPPVPPAPSPSPLPTHDPAAPVVGGVTMASTGLLVPPGTPALPTDISAGSWVVADLDTGAILGACAPHAYGAPASLQKLLLAAAVMPKLKPADLVTITHEDLNFEAGSSAVGLIEGGKYTVETLWLGLLLNSGNDAANVLARLGGNGHGVPGGVAEMNATARRLGAFDTHAETPSGLDGPGQVTSAYDLALIARADFARPDFSRYTATKTAQMPPEPPKDPHGFQIQNDNQLLFAYPGAIGGKTGFTDIARHTYMGAAQRDGRRLVVTMLDGEHQPVRMWQQGASLLDWGFGVAAGASVGRLVEPGEAVPAPTPSASLAAAVGAPAAPADRNDTPPLLAVGAGGLALLAAAGILAGLVLRRRRRDRPAGRGSL